MIVNAYAVLDTFLCLLRFGCGTLVATMTLSMFHLVRESMPEDTRTRLENRRFLLLSTASLLLLLNILSWPLLYLLLQSYIPEWPGVMCIYGVTQIGKGSVGIARILPNLVTLLQLMKPALVFVSGAWFILYLIDKQATGSPFTRKILLVLAVSGMLGTVDAAAELAYLTIPKKEQPLTTGCCTTTFDDESRTPLGISRAFCAAIPTGWWYGVYYGVNLGILVLLTLFDRKRGELPGVGWLTLLLIATSLCTTVSGLFLIEVASPRLIRLPDHHCPYDLCTRAPEALLAVVLFLVGQFAVGWAFLARLCGYSKYSRGILDAMVTRLLRLANLGYSGSLLMMSVEFLLT